MDAKFLVRNVYNRRPTQASSPFEGATVAKALWLEHWWLCGLGLELYEAQFLSPKLYSCLFGTTVKPLAAVHLQLGLFDLRCMQIFFQGLGAIFATLLHKEKVYTCEY